MFICEKNLVIAGGMFELIQNWMIEKEFKEVLKQF